MGQKPFFKIFSLVSSPAILEEEKPTEKGKEVDSWIIKNRIAKDIIVKSLDDSEAFMSENWYSNKWVVTHKGSYPTPNVVTL